MTPEQCVQARRLLGWSRYRLAGMSGVPESFVQIYENTGRASPGRTQSAAERVAASRHVLEAAGVEFVEENGGGSGARLRRSRK